jgi:hypothetical protein
MRTVQLDHGAPARFPFPPLAMWSLLALPVRQSCLKKPGPQRLDAYLDTILFQKLFTRKGRAELPIPFSAKLDCLVLHCLRYLVVRFPAARTVTNSRVTLPSDPPNNPLQLPQA